MLRLIWLPLIPLGIALLLLCAAVLAYFLNINSDPNSITTQGEVVALTPVETRVTGDNNATETVTRYVETIAFRDQNDQLHRFQNSFQSDPPIRQTGDQVPVVYLPDAPEAAEVHSNVENLFLSMLIAGVASFFGFFGFIGLGLWLIFYLFSQTTRAKARRWGRPILAEFDYISIEVSAKPNERARFCVHVKARSELDGKFRYFKSHAVWGDPEDIPRDGQFSVYFNPAQPGQYYVDIEPYLIPES